MKKPVILLGSGGHASVLLGMLRRLDTRIIGIADPHRQVAEKLSGVEILGDDAVVLNYAESEIELINGLGSLPNDGGLRQRVFDDFRRRGYRFRSVVDPKAFVAVDVGLGEGVQIMAGVIIQAGTKIAENCIVNSGAIVEHDCRIGKHVHVAPGAVLSGGIEIGDNVHIGTGAIIIQGIRIGNTSIVGAGSVVTRDIGDHQIVYPARSQIQDLARIN